MKMQFLFCMLITVMMLCGCTAAASDAAAAPESAAPAPSSQSERPAGSVPAGMQAPRTDDGMEDGSAAAEDPQEGRLLDGGELQALWARLEGKWILSDPAEWAASDGFARPVYELIPNEDGGCTLLEYSGYGSGAYQWEWTAARERDGVYTVRATSEGGEMTQYNCRQNSGTRFRLQFTEEGVLLARSRPTRLEWWETEPTEEHNAVVATRLATEEECERLAREGDEYGRVRLLEECCVIVAGYEKPASAYRLVTDEELARLLEEADA